MIQTSVNNEGANTLTSTERRSALARIEAPDLRDQLPPRAAVSGDSGRLQDVEIHYDDELPQDQPVQTMVITTGGSAQSQSRAPASQRLGGLASLRSREKTKTVIANSSTLPTEGETSKIKPTVKRKTIKPTVKKRVVRSPLNLRKSTLVPSQNAPRRKLVPDKAPFPASNKAGSSRRGPKAKQPPANPNTSVDIPSRSNGGADFRSPPPSLP